MTEQNNTAIFKFTLKASSGYSSDGEYKNVTPDQYGRIMAVLNGTDAHDDLMDLLRDISRELPMFDPMRDRILDMLAKVGAT